METLDTPYLGKRERDDEDQNEERPVEDPEAVVSPFDGPPDPSANVLGVHKEATSAEIVRNWQ